MSSPDSWDGVLDDRLMADLGHFWAGRNSAGKVIVGVPGLANVVYLEHLPRSRDQPLPV